MSQQLPAEFAQFKENALDKLAADLVNEDPNEMMIEESSEVEQEVNYSEMNPMG